MELKSTKEGKFEDVSVWIHLQFFFRECWFFGVIWISSKTKCCHFPWEHNFTFDKKCTFFFFFGASISSGKDPAKLQTLKCQQLDFIQEKWKFHFCRVFSALLFQLRFLFQEEFLSAKCSNFVMESNCSYRCCSNGI